MLTLSHFSFPSRSRAGSLFSPFSRSRFCVCRCLERMGRSRSQSCASRLDFTSIGKSETVGNTVYVFICVCFCHAFLYCIKKSTGMRYRGLIFLTTPRNRGGFPLVLPLSSFPMFFSPPPTTGTSRHDAQNQARLDGAARRMPQQVASASKSRHDSGDRSRRRRRRGLLTDLDGRLVRKNIRFS